MKNAKLLELKCSSVFATYAYDYVEQNRAIGNKFNIDTEVLNQFDRFCVERGVSEPVVSQRLLHTWCEKRAAENATNHHIRIRCIRNFSTFLHKNGVEAPHRFHPMPAPPKTFVPYIFTRGEITCFLQAVDRRNSEPNVRSPLLHLVLPLLFRMLYTCGLRVNEALTLRSDGADLEQGVLRILNAKGGTDRLVAMSESLTALCREYRDNMLVRGFGSEYFFPAPDRGFYDSSTVYDWFRQCLLLADIGHGGRGKGPRLHDLRHTFAVHTLGNWVAQGKDLYVCLPILSAYLGHKGLSSTQHYLRLVPEAYSDVTAPFERCYSGVFPEVRDEKQ